MADLVQDIGGHTTAVSFASDAHDVNEDKTACESIDEPCRLGRHKPLMAKLFPYQARARSIGDAVERIQESLQVDVRHLRSLLLPEGIADNPDDALLHARPAGHLTRISSICTSVMAPHRPYHPFHRNVRLRLPRGRPEDGRFGVSVVAQQERGRRRSPRCPEDRRAKRPSRTVDPAARGMRTDRSAAARRPPSRRAAEAERRLIGMEKNEV
jgi:hypothetical protein